MKWQKISIEDLCAIKGGKRLPKNHSLVEAFTNHPYIRARDIGNGIIDFSKPVYLEEHTYNLISHYTVKENDIVLTIVGANIGDVGLIPKELDGANLTENAVKLTSFKENCYFKFLLYFFLLPGKKKEIEQVAAGSAQGKLGLYKIRDIEVPIPDFTTQRKIASILSAYDDLIENNLKRIELLEERLVLEYSMLEEETMAAPEYDFSDYVSFIKGFEPGSSNYLSERSENTLPFIRVGDLNKRGSEIFIEEEKSNGIICLENDVLISLDGTIGIVRFGLSGCYSSGIRKAVSLGVLNNAFIYCYLSSKRIQGIIYSHSKGATIQHAGSVINYFKIKLPREKDLNDFIEFSNPIYSLILILQKQNTKLRESRDILLPRLMSGDIEV